MTNLSQSKSRISYFNNPISRLPKVRTAETERIKSAGAKESGDISLRRNVNFFNDSMRLYIVWCLTHPKDPKDFREIKCEECSSYENLEFHHEKYAPEEEVYLKDIKISCCKCHRNAPVVKGKQRPQLKTVFENGKRYCITSKYKFGY